jgi:hypothetical protein
MSSGFVQAEEEAYYTWIDENGVVNYSERDPKDQNAIYVTPATARFGYRTPPSRQSEENNQQANLPTGQRSSDADEQPEDGDEQFQAEKDQVQQAIAKVKASNCQVGRRNLARLEAYALIRVKDSDGTERVLTDQEKQAKIDQAKRTIRENCTNS